MADDFEQLEELPDQAAVEALFEPEDEPLDVDEELRLSEEALEQDDLIVEVTPELEPIGKSWEFDFQAQRFRMAGHSPRVTSRRATLRNWIEKCLRTHRNAHPALEIGYGMVGPVEDFIGTAPVGAGLDDLKMRVEDALIFHPAIVRIDDFTTEISENDAEGVVFVAFTAVLDDDTRIGVETAVS